MLDDPDVPLKKRKTAQELWNKLPREWIEGREETRSTIFVDQPARPVRKRKASPAEAPRDHGPATDP